MSSIEDIIRRIAREEIARLFPKHRDRFVEPQTDAPDDLLYQSRPIVPRYEKRNGCTCPPGAQTSCPDKACPWKP